MCGVLGRMHRHAATCARRLTSTDPPTQLHENAAEVLGAVSRARACPLTAGLAQPQALALLARHAFAPEPRPRRVHVRLAFGLRVW